MQAIIYYLSFPLLYLVSLLPFWALYLLSDFMYVVLYHIIGYRRVIVMQNLRNSFPRKTEKELSEINRKFYRHLCDMIFETLKTLTMSLEQVIERCRFNPEALATIHRLHAQNKNITIVMGHYGNWEWAGSTMSIEGKYQLQIIYHPVANKYFDGLMKKIRTKFGAGIVAMQQAARDVMRNKNNLTATVFVADQTPAPENAYWTKFLNQDTPFFLGIEKLSRKMDYPVIYGTIRKIKRGYYEICADTIAPNPQSTKDGEITETFTRRLEQDIIKQPEIWLWSHRRWKHKRK